MEITRVVHRLHMGILPELDVHKRLAESSLPVELLLDGAGASHLNIETVIDHAGEQLSKLDQPVQIVLLCSYDELFANWIRQVRRISDVPVIVRVDMSNVKTFDIDESNRLEDVRTHLARSLVRIELVNRDHNHMIVVALFVAGHLRHYGPKAAA